jgi:hypothetical protein
MILGGCQMSREDIIAVATRLFAVFLALASIRYASQAVAFLDGEHLRRTVWFLAETLLPLIVALPLWFFPLTVAHKLLPVMRGDKKAISSETTPLIEVGCTLLGLWLLAAAISDVVYWSLFLFIVSHQSHDYTLSAENIGAIITTIIEFAVALWLLLGYRGILETIRRFRTAGAYTR